MDFRALEKKERSALLEALKGNAFENKGLLMGRDTSFLGSLPEEAFEEVSGTEVIDAIRSTPTHY